MVKVLPLEITTVLFEPGHDSVGEGVLPVVGGEPAVPVVIFVVGGTQVVF